MHVISYLAGIPSKNRNPEKPEVLRRFVQGAIAAGDTGEIVDNAVIKPCDVAVIQGWQHEHGKTAPHLQFRQTVVDTQLQRHRHVIVVDSNLFNYIDQVREPAVRYSRFSMDGVFPITGNYFWDTIDPTRWAQISRDLGISLRPWRVKGYHILICTQRNGGWSMKGLTVADWLDQTVQQIRRYTDRPIVVRPHPGDKKSASYISGGRGYKISTAATILDDFHKAWAVVTYNSSPGVAAAIEGIPVFVTDPIPEYSQAFPVANTDLSLLENPKMWQRETWVERLSMCHWNRDELGSGAAWRHMRQFVT
jgi:hypothetical protein